MERIIPKKSDWKFRNRLYNDYFIYLNGEVVREYIIQFEKVFISYEDRIMLWNNYFSQDKMDGWSNSLGNLKDRVDFFN